MTRREIPEALLTRLLDVKALVEELVHDVRLAAESVGPQRPGAQRAYVRAVFAMVEGTLSGMASYLLEGRSLGGWQLTDEEVRVLCDAVPHASAERPDAKRATLTELTKLTFKAGRRIFGNECPADFGGKGFATFRETINVRDRLMHPKLRADLIVSVDELAKVDQARDWFRFGAQAFFNAAALELRRTLDSKNGCRAG